MFVQVGDVRLFFDVLGAGFSPDGHELRERQTILVLHGGPGLDHSSLRPACDVLSALGQVIYLDQRGHGRSDRSAPEHWTLDQWADDVRSFCDAVGIQRPVVIGTSFGGYVAMHYAIRHPDRLAKLVLISTSPRGTENPTRRARILSAFDRRGGAVACEAARRVLDDRTPDAFAEYLRVCGPLYTHQQPEVSAAKRSIANWEVLTWFERPGGEGAVFDLQPRLAAVRCPTLILGGDDDPITPPDEQQEIVNALPQGTSRFVRFARCGHGVWRDAPEGAFKEIARFFSNS